MTSKAGFWHRGHFVQSRSTSIDDSRLCCFNHFVANTQLLHGPGHKVAHNHISLFASCRNISLPRCEFRFRSCSFSRDEAEEVSADTVYMWPIAPGDITHVKPLYLDYSAPKSLRTMVQYGPIIPRLSLKLWSLFSGLFIFLLKVLRVQHSALCAQVLIELCKCCTQ